MGLTYHFRFSAPAGTGAAELADFLRGVEADAQRMGFDPTVVIDAPFDTEERRLFSRRLTMGLTVYDPRLNGPRLPESAGVLAHAPDYGSCVIAPEHGVILVITDERGMETIFGFFRYPDAIRDGDGVEIMPLPCAGRWVFSEFMKTADLRYREIVRRFAEAGFVVFERDDYDVRPQALA